MADIPEKALMDAVDILKTYADFIRNDVRADDFERHPYLPHIEQTIEDLRAAPPAMDREALLTKALRRISAEPLHSLPIVTTQRMRNIADFALLGEDLA
ncbi:hypothetical protein NZL82_15360 [Sphingomonas sanguinis]|uniref:hypothetical protein n=1 Tax=Sphingomonas sp. LC-1 TaxID=3110957 RepID=UPI0021BB0AD1|nr:hypothetical protein [Sphingomonas sp. LC-1]MCT8003253.1 hypothetical protein [Sphingomonas sp. LC-1]